MKSIEEGPAGFPTGEEAGGAGVEVYRGGTGRVPNEQSRRTYDVGSLSRRDRQGSQPGSSGSSTTRKSIEEGPAGFPTRGAGPVRRGEVYRGGTGRVPNRARGAQGSAGSLSRRDRQGSQRTLIPVYAGLKSIEEGPAGFPTRGHLPVRWTEVHRGGTGRVPNRPRSG